MSDLARTIKVGLIGGTGLGQVLPNMGVGERHRVSTPFGCPSDDILQTRWAGIEVYVLARHGPGHLLHPSQVPYRANIFALKQLGCTHILASGAVGSLREEFKPRDLVVCDQAIDKTSKRALTFFERAAVHVEFAEPFCPILRQIVLEAGQNPKPEGYALHDRGCYVCMEGPAFSTRAESLMHRLWGGDLIGMTLMPEAKLAREAEMAYAQISLVTDYDCWRNKPAEASSSTLLEEIMHNLQTAAGNAMGLMRRSIEVLAAKGPAAFGPAHEALQRAIWSNKAQIPAEEVQRLAPLWMKYFEPAV